jgi:hypothetical protein
MNERALEFYRRYVHNLGLAQRAESALPNDKDWVSVFLFYAAVHLMNAYLLTKRNVVFDPKKAEHTSRWQAIMQCPEIRHARADYRDLKDLSEAVRYDVGYVFGTQDLQNAKAHFDKVVSVVLPKLKRILGIP